MMPWGEAAGPTAVEKARRAVEATARALVAEYDLAAEYGEPSTVADEVACLREAIDVLDDARTRASRGVVHVHISPPAPPREVIIVVPDPRLPPMRR